MMSWYYYPPPPLYPPLPYDIFALFGYTLHWMIYPYYWLLYLEAFKASFDVWKKVLESFTKYITPPTT